MPATSSTATTDKNSYIFVVLDKFRRISTIIAKILAFRRNTPDITPSDLEVISDFVILLNIYKEISGDQFVNSSLAIPFTKIRTDETPS